MVTNRITKLFQSKNQKILSVFFTAGYPELHDTVSICTALEEEGVDLIEIGFPFSDSLVDGSTIQASNEIALKNGMALTLLFEQLRTIRAAVSIPLVLMSCVNPLMQYGLEKLCEQCAAVGIDGVIIPDLLPEEYLRNYRSLFEQHQLSNISLITTRTPVERIKMIDSCSEGFIYMVSSDATTGGGLELDAERKAKFETIAAMDLKNPLLIGFGITDQKSFQAATEYTQGGIIGSAFIRALKGTGELKEKIANFIERVR